MGFGVLICMPIVLAATRTNVHSEWSHILLQKPLSTAPENVERTRGCEEKIDSLTWYDYRFMQDCYLGRPGLFATSNREKAKLIHIIRDATLLYSSTKHIGADQVLVLYGRFLRWRREFPHAIGDFRDAGRVMLPHVLSLL